MPDSHPPAALVHPDRSSGGRVMKGLAATAALGALQKLGATAGADVALPSFLPR